MKIENPYTKDLQDAIKNNDHDKIVELQTKSREFIQSIMNKSVDEMQVFKQKTDEKIAAVKNVGLTNKENRKIVKAIYDEAILMNREFNEVLIVNNRELKRLCREYLFPNQTKENKEQEES